MGRKSHPRFRKINYDRKRNENPERRDSDYTKIEMKNERFEEYYKAQRILNDQEFEQFMTSLKVPLPSSFRITGSRSHATELKDLMIKEYFPSLEDFELDGERVEVPKPVPWYPDDLAWVSSLARNVLRRSPQMSKFHRFLVAETEVGNINRQEVVSMIPVQLMDVRPNHAVLDMCAAPGSKTAQILEALHANESEAIPDGLLIANDADQARSHMLVKQAKRLQSPCLMVTNHEAQQFPNIFFAPKGSLDASVLQFDRILADVPCSGDGTLRKNMPIWQTWTQGNGNALHRVQLPILLRGCSLLKVGGRIVYSTCSFNPLENEAVVAGALKVAGGALRLVDVSSELPQLVRRQGLSTWKVQSKSGEFYSKFADVPEAESVGLLPSMFPPENAAELNLDRCLRVYPFLQNTGGFFVAVLEKVASYGALDRIPGNEPNVELEATAEEKEETETKEATTVELDTSSINERKRSQDDDSNRSAKRTRTETEGSSEIVKYKSAAAWEGRESPFVFLNSDNQELMGMREFYGLDDSFPQEQFVVRSEKDNYRTVYFVSRAIKNVITASNSFRLNIVNTGIRIFTRSAGNDTGAECPFRLSNEGLATIGRYVSGKRVVQVPMSDIVTLLSIEYPKFTEFGEELQKKLTEMSMGSCIIKFDPTLEKNYTGSARSTILLPIWRAHVSVSLLLNKQERKSLMHRLTGEDLSIQGGLDNNAGGGSTEGESQKAAIAGETEPTTESVA